MRNEQHRLLMTGGILIICLLGVALRIVAAVHIGELYDEVVDVNWVGTWFSYHLLAYIFQWQHNFFPPQSPSFSNPPFAMYVFGIAIAIGRTVHASPLLAARLADVGASLGLILTAYAIAGRWLTGVARLSVPAFLALSPPAVTIGASAYQETLAALAAAFVVLVLIRYNDEPTTKRWGLLAVCMTLALLVKLTNLIVLACVLVTILYAWKRKRAPLWHLLVLPVAIAVIAAIAWAGARDFHQLSAAVDYVVHRRALPGYPSEYPQLWKPFYYLAMLVGTQASLVSLFLAGACVVSTVCVLRRRSLDGETVWTAAFWFAFLSLGELVQFSTRHQLGVPILSAAMIIGFGVERLSRIRMPKAAATAALAAIVLAALSVFVSPPASWNAFNNALVGRMPQHIYATGDGDMLPSAASWINRNSPQGVRIGVYAAAYLLQPLLTGGRTSLVALPNDTVESLLAARESYLVMPGDFLAFPPLPVTSAAKSLPLVYAVKVSGKDYIDVFRLPQPPHETDRLRGAPRLGSHGNEAVVEFENQKLTGDGIVLSAYRNIPVNLFVDIYDPKSSDGIRYFFPPTFGTTFDGFAPFADFKDWRNVAARDRLTISKLRRKRVTIRFSITDYTSNTTPVLSITDAHFAQRNVERRPRSR